MGNAFYGLEDTFNVEHNLVNTPLEGYRDVFLHEGSPSLAYDNVIPNSLEHSHVSTFCSPPSFSPELDFDVRIDNFEICDSNVDLGHEDNMFHMLGGNVDNFESLGNLCGYDAALDLYCIYLVDKHRKIMRNTFFDFSMAFALIKRELTYFTLILCVLSHSQAWKPYSEEFDKLLRALTMSGQKYQVLT